MDRITRLRTSSVGVMRTTFKGADYSVYTLDIPLSLKRGYCAFFKALNYPSGTPIVALHDSLLKKS